MTELDFEAMRRARRQQRLEWAYRSAGQTPPDRRASGAAVQGGTPPAASLSSADWSVDVGLVERHRIVRGWSRLQLATIAHVDPKTLRDLLGRRRRPNLGTVQAVSVALGLTLADVIRFA